jgi:EmrB/QacA subfamily drug resistance transporter
MPDAERRELPIPHDVICRWLPWLVAVALFMENLDATIVNTATPTMALSLGVRPLSLKGVLTSYTLALAVFIPISGWAADRYGTRRIFRTAIMTFAAGSLLCGLAVNVPMLVASRLLQGAGGAMMTPVGRLALVRSFPRQELITILNYVVIPAMIGPLLGPFLGGVIVHWLHWRVIFFINLPLSAVGLWLAHRYMPDYREERAPPLDWTGFLLFGAGVMLLSYVLEVLGDHTLPLVNALQLALAASILLAGSVWHARRAASPVLDLDLFRIRTFRVSVLGGFVTRLGAGGMPFLLPLLYQVGMGFSPWQAGLLMMPQALASMAMKFTGKAVLSRFGYRRVLRVNTVMMGLLIGTFSLVGPGTSLVAIIALSLVQGLASSTQFTSMNSLVFADVSDRAASRASSIASTAQQLALSFGVALGSVTAQWFLHGVAPADRTVFVSALHHAFLLLGGITVVASTAFATLQANDGSNVSQYRGKAEFEELSEKTA